MEPVVQQRPPGQPTVPAAETTARPTGSQNPSSITGDDRNGPA
ncbi:MAG: hypothetical protein ACRD1K_09235 [Acidimicrobiales bacterium]